MGKLREGAKTRIRHGHTIDDTDRDVDVSGLTGTIDDAEGYDNERTGDRMVGVKLDAEHGGGIVYAPAQRLHSGGAFVGFSAKFAANFDRIFGKKKKAR